jgi:hypothetical protein
VVPAGESGYEALLKTRKLLLFQDAKNAQASEIASNWSVSGTQTPDPTLVNSVTDILYWRLSFLDQHIDEVMRGALNGT